MSAVTRRILRYGSMSLIPGGPDQPDIYGEVRRVNWYRVDWRIAEGLQVVAAGRAWTRGGAWVKATAAAHRIGGRP